MNDWDSLGVAEIPEAADQYDGYIAGIYRLLYSQPSIEEVARHLQEKI
jgi:hypothetical protein